MAEIEAVDRRDPAPAPAPPDERPGDFLDQIDESFADVDQPRHDQLVARDVIVLHLGSQSNLFAALAWTLANLLHAPDDLAAVARRRRAAARPVRLRVDPHRAALDHHAPGPAPARLRGRRRHLPPRARRAPHDHALGPQPRRPRLGLDRFDPDHYDGRRLVPADELPAKELVSTFGHGSHTCPAQRFSISAIRTAIAAPGRAYDLTPQLHRTRSR